LIFHGRERIFPPRPFFCCIENGKAERMLYCCHPEQSRGELCSPAKLLFVVILNEVKDLILPQSAFADSSLKEGAIEDSSVYIPSET